MKSIASICFLVLLLTGCGYSPQFLPSNQTADEVLLSDSNDNLLLQIYDEDVDASWELNIRDSSILINEDNISLKSAVRHEYLTQQNAFAYLLNIERTKIVEGKYTVNAVISKGNSQRDYKGAYNMKIEFGSLFHYLYGMYHQERVN